ncbi:GTPase-associated system all-helical protein GASH [Oscillibacter sp.]|uniref:GTPase-associated system all-helical protein GASH n=1 Tax=Oscillibacter sp. TaxID=1945593 RepID=UPI0028A8490A|nr:GTPase-associated system all-helical protein GASH [Oscillibacter sp.]
MSSSINSYLNEWYIDAGIIPQDGQIDKRIAYIENYVEAITREKILGLVRLYFGLPVVADEKVSFASFFVKSDPSFSLKNEVEIAVLAGATLVEVAETDSTFDSLAELLSITVAFSRDPIASAEMLDFIKKQFETDRIDTREKQPPKEISVPSKSLITSFQKQLEQESWDAESFAKLSEVLEKFQEGFSTIQDAFHEALETQAVYKEDSQLLWWMQSKWSNILNCSLKTIDKKNSSLILGWEAASFITNYPGPYSIEGILENVLSACKGKANNIEFSEVVMSTDKRFTSKVITQLSHSSLIDTLPLCKAIISSDNTERAEEWYPKFKRETFSHQEDLTRSLREYSMQMYTERLAACCYDSLKS